MELVLVERRFEQPVEFENIQCMESRAQWCLEAHGVRFLETFFSRDKRRMICIYEAPDAEAVRAAQRQAQIPLERAWTCAVLRPEQQPDQAPTAEYVVAERAFPEPITLDFVLTAFESASSCMDRYGAKVVESFFGSDGYRMVCVFSAPDAEAVRRANQQAGLPYVHVWTASRYSG